MRLLKSLIRNFIFDTWPMEVYNWEFDYIKKNNLDVKSEDCWEKAKIALNEYSKGKEV